MSSHVLQDFKSKHNQEDPVRRVIEFSFVLEDSGPDVAWPLDGNPVVQAKARISPNGQLLISGAIVEAPKDALELEQVSTEPPTAEQMLGTESKE